MAFEQAFPPIQPVEPAPPKGRAPWGYADMAMAIAVVIGSLIVISIPIVIIISIVTGGELGDGDEIGAPEIGVGFVLELLLLLAAAMFSVRKYKLSWASLGLRLPKRGGYWFPIPLFFAAMIILAVYAAIVTGAGGNTEGNVPEETFDSTTLLIVFLGILVLGLAPIMEETFFRGFLFGGLRGRWGLLGGAFASGLLFALAHYTGVDSLSVLPAIGIIGMLFAWGYYYTGSLFAPVVAHFGFNLVAFIVGVAG